MQSLFTKFEKFNFTSKIFPNNVFRILGHRRFVYIPVYSWENINFIWKRFFRFDFLEFLLTPIYIFCPLEKPWYVVLQYGERLVEFLQDTHNSVVLLHILLGFPQGNLCVKAPENFFYLIKTGEWRKRHETEMSCYCCDSKKIFVGERF